MKSRLISVGNSRGLRIPKALLEEAGLKDEIEISVKNGQLLITSIEEPRKGWSLEFAKMAERKDDLLLDQVLPESTTWDDSEWQW